MARNYDHYFCVILSTMTSNLPDGELMELGRRFRDALPVETAARELVEQTSVESADGKGGGWRVFLPSR